MKTEQIIVTVKTVDAPYFLKWLKDIIPDMQKEKYVKHHIDLHSIKRIQNKVA